MNLKKIIKEEINDFDWMLSDTIKAIELEEHIHEMGLKTIKGFKKVIGDLSLNHTDVERLGTIEEVTPKPHDGCKKKGGKKGRRL